MKDNTAEFNKILDDLTPYNMVFNPVNEKDLSSNNIIIKLNDRETKIILQIPWNARFGDGKEIENDGEIFEKSIYDRVRSALQNDFEINDDLKKEAQGQLLQNLIQRRELEDRSSFLSELKVMLDKLPAMSPEFYNVLTELNKIHLDETDINSIDEDVCKRMDELHKKIKDNVFKKFKDDKNNKILNPCENLQTLYPQQSEKLQNLGEIINKLDMMKGKGPEELEKIARRLNIPGAKLENYFQANIFKPSKSSTTDKDDKKSTTSMAHSGYWYSDADMGRLGKEVIQRLLGEESIATQFNGGLTFDQIKNYLQGLDSGCALKNFEPSEIELVFKIAQEHQEVSQTILALGNDNYKMKEFNHEGLEQLRSLLQNNPKLSRKLYSNLDSLSTKPIFIAYNMGGSGSNSSEGGTHWIALTLLKHQGRTKLLYKDPKGDSGGNAEKIKEEFKKYHPDIEFIKHEGSEQLDNDSCGPMTINNLEIVIKHFKEAGLDSLIEGFGKLDFTKQKEVLEIRAKHAGLSLNFSSIEDEENIQTVEEILDKLIIVDDKQNNQESYMEEKDGYPPSLNQKINKETLKSLIEKIDSYYEQVKEWGADEIVGWFSRNRRENNSGESNDFSPLRIDLICEAIGVMERANQIATSKTIIDPETKEEKVVAHRLRDTQKVAILIFMQSSEKGHISQINTGEGKTTIVSFVQALRVMQGYKGHVITSNNVLAAEGAQNKQTFYELLGISVTHNNPEEGYTKGARECYDKDIVYGSITSFQFDWLRHSFEGLETLGDLDFKKTWVMLDEIDSLLIDQGGNIAKLSSPFPGMESLRYIYINIWAALEEVEEVVISSFAEDPGSETQPSEERKKFMEELRIKYAKELSKSDQKVTDGSASYEEGILVEQLESLANESQQIQKDLGRLDLLEENEVITYEKNQGQKFLKNIKEKIREKNLINKEIIPQHLHEYAESSLDKWIEYAFAAKYQYTENIEYKIELDKKNGERIVVPVDNHNTGVTMKNTILSNGLHQFLQIKHNLCLTYESLTSSYISNLGYILYAYGNRLSGVTGTLGSEKERIMLGKVFELTFSVIPPYKPKNFEQFEICVFEDNIFIKEVAMAALAQIIENKEKAKKSRAVLVICYSILDVEAINKEVNSLIQSLALTHKIKIYRDEKDADIIKDTVNIGDIIIATNIAGRGTDFQTTRELESNGGLHVIEAFLPCNQRVQDQGLGRTSRQGNSGTGQIIARSSEIQNLPYGGTIIERRDDLEAERLDNIMNNKVLELKFKDKLFSYFSNLHSEVKNKHEDNETQRSTYVLLDLKEKWAFWLEKQGYSAEGIKQLINSENPSEERVSEAARAEFDNFENEDKTQKIINGQISHNPFYAISLAERYLEMEARENKTGQTGIEMAKIELHNAIEIANNSSESLYSAHMKLFEVAIEEGGQLLERFKKAVADIFFVKVSKNEKYKENALGHLRKAERALSKEYNYLEELLGLKGEQADALETNSNSAISSILISDSTEQKDPNYQNIFLKHLLSRHTCLGIILGNIKSLIKQIEETKGKEEEKKGNDDKGVIIGTKIPRYLSQLDPKAEKQAELKKYITDREVNELEHIGISPIIQLQEVHDVPDEIIGHSKSQIACGFYLLGIAMICPTAGPMAGVCISEGITDIIMALIDQGKEGFNQKSYTECKLISYGIAVATMGISAIARCTEILSKVMSVCRRLASKLRAVEGPFAKVCNWIATKLEKLACYFESAIRRVEFARQGLHAQEQILSGIHAEASAAHRAGDLASLKRWTSEFQQLRNSLGSTTLTHGQRASQILRTASLGALQGVATSVVTEKIIMAGLHSMMKGLLPQIQEKVKNVIMEKNKDKQELFTKHSKQFILKQINNVFRGNGDIDLGYVAKEISFGLLRHCNDWKMHMLALTLDTLIEGIKIDQCIDNIYGKFLNNLSSESEASTAHDEKYDNQHTDEEIISGLTNLISDEIYNRIVSITGKVAITLPQVLHRGHKQRKERLTNKEIERLIRQKIESINVAGDAAIQAGTTCAHDAVAASLGIDTELLAHSSGIQMSAEGVKIDGIHKLYNKNNIKTSECYVGDAVQKLGELTSDRAVACLTRTDGSSMGHAIPVILEGEKLIVHSSTGRVSLDDYCTEKGYNSKAAKIVVPENVNSSSLRDIKNNIILNRIYKAHENLRPVEQGEGQRYCGRDRGTYPMNQRVGKPKIIIGEDSTDKFSIEKLAIKPQEVASLLGEAKNKDFDKVNNSTSSGYRIERGTSGKSNNIEMQRNGKKRQGEKTTVALVILDKTDSTESYYFSLREGPEKQNARDNIAAALQYSLTHREAVKITKTALKLPCDEFNSLLIPKNAGHKNKNTISMNNIGEYWLDYRKVALEQLLELRLQSINSDTTLYQHTKIMKTKLIDFNNHQSISLYQRLFSLQDKLCGHVNNKDIQNILVPTLISGNRHVYHWVGLALMRQESNLKIVYLDSENQLIAPELKQFLLGQLPSVLPELKFSFRQQPVEQQRYNNCGLELIENFVQLLTRQRASQENAPYLHSELWVQKLIMEDISQRHPKANNIDVNHNKRLNWSDKMAEQYRSSGNQCITM